MRVLIVDDEKMALNSLRRVLKRSGIKSVETCDNGKDAIRRIKEENFDLVLLDLLMPQVDGVRVLEATKPYKPYTEFIILTGVDDISSAVKVIRLGAYDYLVKPVDDERLLLCIERAYERRGLLAGLAGARSGNSEADIPEAFSDIITQDPRMKELLSYALIMSRSGNPILITGETGTGKELLAQGMHRAGSSPQGPFIAVNVSSIPETLFESQFFGHVEGAFTGANKGYAGYFEQADRGTLFLDEIGELPLNLQSKLLRALEEKSITRLGETRPRQVDVRIVSATNMDLDTACQEGRFRFDLMYRLKSVRIHLPPSGKRHTISPFLLLIS
jgi:DNA-binding NtrC family response regulator